MSMSFLFAERLAEPLSTLTYAHRQANYLSRKRTALHKKQSERSERKRELPVGASPLIPPEGPVMIIVCHSYKCLNVCTIGNILAKC